jgi:hypothetical protein
VYEKQRGHSAVFVKGEDGFLHYFYQQAGIWAHDGASFHAAGQISGPISSVFDVGQYHASVFVRGGDGLLHYFYALQGNWAHDVASFSAAGQISGAISAVYEEQRGHASVFVRGTDGLLHYFHVVSGLWRHDSPQIAGQVSADPGAISAVFEPAMYHASVFVRGADGFLHYISVFRDTWRTQPLHPGAGQISGAVSGVYEVSFVLKSYHASVFTRGADGFLHYFFCGLGKDYAWQLDATSFQHE